MEYQVMQQNALIAEMRTTSALRDRKIYLSDEVDRDSIFEVIYFMDRIRSIDDKEGLPISKRKPIEIICDSYGGSCYHGLTLISKIEEFKDLGYTIITTVSGVAMSMGAMILIVGSKRQAYRHARIMFHQPSSGTWGTLQQQEDDTDETKAIWKRMKDIIKKYTNFTEEKLEKMKREHKDLYLWGEEALKLKVIDSII